MKTSLQLFCAAVALSIAVTAQADAPLRAGDTFELRIGGVPTEEGVSINSIYTIDGGGGLNLPYIGKLTVENMTSSEVQSLVERTYVERGIFTHPSITLVTQAQARFVNVGGHVKSPQRVPYTPDMTLMSAINAAGDFDVRRSRQGPPDPRQDRQDCQLQEHSQKPGERCSHASRRSGAGPRELLVRLGRLTAPVIPIHVVRADEIKVWL